MTRIVLDCPDKIGGRDHIQWNVHDPGLVKRFVRVLQAAKDERPLQKFFEKYPVALLTGLVRPHRGFVIPRPDFPLPHGGVIPDFVVCEWSSIGPKWIIVELESPRRSPFKKAGIADICNHAVQQIRSARTYLRNNTLLLRAHGWPLVHGDCDGVVVIGRRDDPLRELHAEKLEALRRDKVEVMSYDRLVEHCEDLQVMLEREKKELATILKPRSN